MRDKTCYFIGHRSISNLDMENVTIQTKLEIEKLIKKGVTNFICGGLIGYDILCGQIVIELKKKYSHIQLTVALLNKFQDKYYDEKQKLDFQELLFYADKTIYLSENDYWGSMHDRNYFVIENSKYVITFCNKKSGGTYYTINYIAKCIECIMINVK